MKEIAHGDPPADLAGRRERGIEAYARIFDVPEKTCLLPWRPRRSGVCGGGISGCRRSRVAQPATVIDNKVKP
jgi:hypothetical protein